MHLERWIQIKVCALATIGQPYSPRAKFRRYSDIGYALGYFDGPLDTVLSFGLQSLSRRLPALRCEILGLHSHYSHNVFPLAVLTEVTTVAGFHLARSNLEVQGMPFWMIAKQVRVDHIKVGFRHRGGSLPSSQERFDLRSALGFGAEVCIRLSTMAGPASWGLQHMQANQLG